MLIATHSIVGAVIGTEVNYPPLAFILGFISHFILDVIPHNDGPDDVVGRTGPNSINQYLVVAVDGLVAICTIIYFGQSSESASFFWGALGGITPDLIDNVPILKEYVRKLKVFDKFHQFHYWIQSRKAPLILGIPLQYAIFFLGVLFLLKVLK